LVAGIGRQAKADRGLSEVAFALRRLLIPASEIRLFPGVVLYVSR
jgi:hypothetical protein